MSTIAPPTPRELYARMHEIAETSNDIMEVTRRWLASMDAEEIAILHFRFARAEVVNHMRGMVRAIEYDEPGKGDAGDEAFSLPLFTQRQLLLDKGVWVPGCGYIDFGNITPTDLRARAAWLRKLAAGNIRTAEWLEQIADEIEQAGVTCMLELES